MCFFFVSEKNGKFSLSPEPKSTKFTNFPLFTESKNFHASTAFLDPTAKLADVSGDGNLFEMNECWRVWQAETVNEESPEEQELRCDGYT